MKLIKVENEKSKSGDPLLGISKTGTFQFNKAAQENCGIKGDVFVDFFQDEEDLKNWYLKIAVEGSLKIRYYEDKGPACSSSSIAKKIKEATGNDPGKSIRCRLGAVVEWGGADYYPLLIKFGSYR